MKYVVAVGLLVVSTFIPALAQSAKTSSTDQPLEFFGGFSHAHLDAQGFNSIGPFPINTSANGVEASVQYNATPFLGLTADFSAHRNTLVQVFRIGVNMHTYTALFGPTVFHNYGRVRPFAHALFGANHVSASVPQVATPQISASSNAFAMALGGGFDFRINKWALVRIAQLDYAPTFHSPAHQSNLRFSTGLVLQF